MREIRDAWDGVPALVPQMAKPLSLVN